MQYVNETGAHRMAIIGDGRACGETVISLKIAAAA